MFGVSEIFIVLIIVFVLFGSSRLPRLSRHIGKTAREIKQGVYGKDDKSVTEIARDINSSTRKIRRGVNFVRNPHI